MLLTVKPQDIGPVTGADFVKGQLSRSSLVAAAVRNEAMRILQGHRRRGSAHSEPDSHYYPTMRLLSRDGDDAPTRYEPQTLEPRAEGATDPYEAWRAKREAERERSRVQAVRWVYRQRGTAAAPVEREATAAEAVRWVNRYRGVGAAPTGRSEASGARGEAKGGGRERPVDLIGAQGG